MDKKNTVKLIKNSNLVGAYLIIISIIIKLINHYYPSSRIISESNLSFFSAIFLLIGILLMIPYYSISNFIYDNHDYDRVTTINTFLSKIRFRALLFNNLSVVIFVFTLLVVPIGFYLLVFPPINTSITDPGNISQTHLTIRIGSSILLIFLVQILFRVFKYLLRVAAFYNAKADAIEFSELEEIKGVTPKMELEKLMKLFTPDKYDISDLPQPTILDKFIK